MVTFEELTSLKEGWGWYVDKLPNAAGMYLRLSEVLHKDMNLDPSKFIVGMMLVGEEWHIVVRSAQLTDSEVELMEKWILSRSRHRARVIKLDEVKAGGFIDNLLKMRGRSQS